MNEFAFINNESSQQVLGKVNGSLATSILDKINAIISIIDVQEQKILWANKFLISLLGYSLEELSAMKSDFLIKFIHPEFRKKFYHLFHPSNKNDKIEDQFYKIKTRHGVWLWIHVTTIPYQYDHSGITTHLMFHGIVTDCCWLTKYLGDTQVKNKEDAFYSILSKRENEILKLISKGLTTREISCILNLSIHTAKTHRRNIIHKLKVRNSADMVRLSMQHGMLDQ